MQQNLITHDEIEKIRPYLPNVDELLNGRDQDFLLELDDAIIGELDMDYEATDTSRMLQNVYDEVLYRVQESRRLASASN